MAKTYVVPTHISTPETVVSFGGLSLSAKQFLWLLIGSALSYDWWLHLAILATLPGGVVLRLVSALLPLGLTCLLAFLRIARRSLAIWLVVLLRYRTRPKCFVWRSVRWHEPELLAPAAEQEEK